MILFVDSDKIKCFADVRAHRNFDSVAVAHQAVRKKMLEFNGNVELISIICAGKDVTERSWNN